MNSVFTYVLSSNHQGYDYFNMVVHGDRESEKNNEAIKNLNLQGMKIVFKPGKSKTYSKPFLLVYLNNKKIGAIFDDKCVRKMISGKVKSLYGEIIEEEVIGSNNKSTIRHRVRLYADFS